MSEPNSIPESHRQVGRNEPCPCRSGKKYKRCCGVNAAPQLTTPKYAEAMGSTAGGETSPDMGGMMPQMDPEMMAKVAQAFQRLPKGQIQRFQAIARKAMQGKDVTREAAELEGSLPLEFQSLIHSFRPMEGAMEGAAGLPQPQKSEVSPVSAQMSEEEARAIVARAAAEGKISQKEAGVLLEEKPKEQGKEEAEKTGFSKFLRKLGKS